MKSLELIGALAGRTIEVAEVDGEWLRMLLSDGHSLHIRVGVEPEVITTNGCPLSPKVREWAEGVAAQYMAERGAAAPEDTSLLPWDEEDEALCR